MNVVEFLEQEVAAQQGPGPLDSMAPSDQMRAIDAAMRQYFESEDWLRQRDKAFPGLGRQYWFNQYGQYGQYGP